MKIGAIFETLLSWEHQMFGRSIFALLVATTSIPSGSLKVASGVLPPHQLSARSGIDLDQVSIGGIKLKMTKQAVLQKLGKPRKTGQEQICYGPVIRLTYPGITIDLEEKGQKKYVTRISTSDSRYGTDRGVKVGDSIEKATKAYAPYMQRNGNILYVPDQKYADSRLILEFNKVYRIASISTHIDC
jgi:hypothetical protein